MGACIRRQRGAIAILVGFTIVVLLLLAGLVLDLGHVHIVKNELQNAADACALSGASELGDLGQGALERATAAATTAGERNWAGLKQDPVDVPEANVTFADTLSSSFQRAITAATTYIRCQTAPVKIDTWLMQLGGYFGDGGTDGVTVDAVAIARRIPGQTLCAIPLAICKTKDEPLVLGAWYFGRVSAGHAITGAYDWVRFPGMSGAHDIADMLAGEGMCSARPERVDGQGGMATGVAQAWNTRFGLYSGAYNDPRKSPPDATGWAYTPVQMDGTGQPICPNGIPSGTWPPLMAWGSFPGRTCAVPDPTKPRPEHDAYDGGGRSSPWYPESYANRHNVTHDPYDPNSLLDENGAPRSLPGHPAAISREQHARLGQDRRRVIMPVIECEDWAPNKKNIKVIGYACALMLAPINDPGRDVVLEFRGWATDSDSNCGTSGFPGINGAPVPALVK